MVLLLASMNVASLMEGCRYGFTVACISFVSGQAGRQALLGPMSGITDTLFSFYVCILYRTLYPFMLCSPLRITNSIGRRQKHVAWAPRSAGRPRSEYLHDLNQVRGPLLVIPVDNCRVLRVLATSPSLLPFERTDKHFGLPFLPSSSSYRSLTCTISKTLSSI